MWQCGSGSVAVKMRFSKVKGKTDREYVTRISYHTRYYGLLVVREAWVCLVQYIPHVAMSCDMWVDLKTLWCDRFQVLDLVQLILSG